ncbi:peptidoglycan-binding protein LysM [Algoriphagus sp.]|uniref:peptidoglycan-binding protein LysM n=1 Tax=Algoriphagus sp. TaxID=1872435 RepID=UPI003918DB5B
MGLFSFIKTAGSKIFGKKELEAPKEEVKKLQASALLNHVNNLGLSYKTLNLSLVGTKVTISGEVEQQQDAEKIVLAVGNVDGVESVEDNLTVVTPQPQAQFHTVVSGDTLSKIAQNFYGSANKYPVIFEANKPMLTHPDKIYPGQVLRIPAEG